MTLSSFLVKNSDEEFIDLIANNGLTLVFENVKNMITSKSMEDFFKINQYKLDNFLSDNVIDSQYLKKIWQHFNSMSCKYKCPWCGMQCCGNTDCNDLYIPSAPASKEKADIMHSCQFHRDMAIIGLEEVEDYVDEENPGIITKCLF